MGVGPGIEEALEDYEKDGQTDFKSHKQFICLRRQ